LRRKYIKDNKRALRQNRLLKCFNFTPFNLKNSIRLFIKNSKFLYLIIKFFVLDKLLNDKKKYFFIFCFFKRKRKKDDQCALAFSLEPITALFINKIFVRIDAIEIILFDRLISHKSEESFIFFKKNS